MFNFKKERWNKVNEPRRWLNRPVPSLGIASPELPSKCETSYFFHEEAHWTKVQAVMKNVDQGILKEKVRQGFAPTTLEVVLVDDEIQFPKLAPPQVESLRKEIEASAFKYIQALGYGTRVYRVSVSGNKFKVLMRNNQ